MKRGSTDPHTRECEVFIRYLVGKRPTPYLVSKYREACHTLHLDELRPGCAAVEPTLLRMASTHPLLTRLADAYSRVFLPESLLRRRLVLLLAIVESTSLSQAALSSRGSRGLWWSIPRLTMHVVAMVVATGIAIPVVLVLRSAARVRTPRLLRRGVAS
jgi:hypothetical protein